MCDFLLYITYKLSRIVENLNEPFYKSSKYTMDDTLHYIILTYSVIISQYLTFALFYLLYYGSGVNYSKNHYIVVLFFIMLLSDICLGILLFPQMKSDKIKKYRHEKNPKLKSLMIVIFVVSLFISGFFAMFWVLDHAL